MIIVITIITMIEPCLLTCFIVKRVNAWVQFLVLFWLAFSSIFPKKIVFFQNLFKFSNFVSFFQPISLQQKEIFVCLITIVFFINFRLYFTSSSILEIISKNSFTTSGKSNIFTKCVTYFMNDIKVYVPQKYLEI